MVEIDVKSEGYKKLVGQVRAVIRKNNGEVDVSAICEKLGISCRFAEELLREMGFRQGADYRDH